MADLTKLTVDLSTDRSVREIDQNLDRVVKDGNHTILEREPRIKAVLAKKGKAQKVISAARKKARRKSNEIWTSLLLAGISPDTPFENLPEDSRKKLTEIAKKEGEVIREQSLIIQQANLDLEKMGVPHNRYSVSLKMVRYKL